jgi:hypothetical protein
MPLKEKLVYEAKDTLFLSIINPVPVPEFVLGEK